MELEPRQEPIALVGQSMFLGYILDDADDADHPTSFHDRTAANPNPAHCAIRPQYSRLDVDITGLIHACVFTQHSFKIERMNALHVGARIVDEALARSAPHILITLADVED